MIFLTALTAAALSTSPNRLVALDDLPAFPPKGQIVQKVFEGIDPTMDFDEAIASWNVKGAVGAAMQVEAKAYGDGFETKWYTLGKWSLDPAVAPRECVEGQRDDNGTVNTDTLSLSRAATKLDLRVTLQNLGDGQPRLSLLTMAFHNTRAEVQDSVSKRNGAWGKTVDVPQRAQGAYKNGDVLCSPTSVSMTLGYWSKRLKRPELDRDVPDVVAGVWDKVYDGAGNWPFNTAYAGSLPGITAYVTRLNSIADAERWVAAGVPVICSVSLDLLLGQPNSGQTGHLAVLIGFTKDGDPVFNDPAKVGEVRRTYRRTDFEKAWLVSRRTVYLIYPEGTKVPDDREGAWIRSKRS